MTGFEIFIIDACVFICGDIEGVKPYVFLCWFRQFVAVFIWGGIDHVICTCYLSSRRGVGGGIQENDCWSLPGGKQELFETMYEGAIRETKEETNLDVSDLELFDACDDITSDRHFVTLQIIAKSSKGRLKAMEPLKEDRWEWFSFDNLPECLYSPSKKFIDSYISKRIKK